MLIMTCLSSFNCAKKFVGSSILGKLAYPSLNESLAVNLVVLVGFLKIKDGCSD